MIDREALERARAWMESSKSKPSMQNDSAQLGAVRMAVWQLIEALTPLADVEPHYHNASQTIVPEP